LAFKFNVHRYAEAAGRVGLCFAKGRGVDQSWERAVHWYKVAANAKVEVRLETTFLFTTLFCSR
jgi:TPR repeat protein